MNFLDVSLPSIHANLALDEVLLLAAEAGQSGEVLRIWEWPTPAVVLGMGGVIADDVERAACERDGVPLARRSSGGGTVLLGSGCLLYSLVLRGDRDPALADIRGSYRWILERMIRALAPVLDCAAAGSSDLAAQGLKFSGNAQQRKRDHILHHGTLLYDFDLAAIPRYLREPPRRPDYRADRRHAEFVRNLPAAGSWLRDHLRQAWSALDPLPTWDRAGTERLTREKYATPEWIERR